jgi:hypothetical protein
MRSDRACAVRRVLFVIGLIVSLQQPAMADRAEILARSVRARIYVLGREQRARTLSDSQTRALLAILPAREDDAVAMCWDPHNGIDLLAADGTLVEKIVVCFTCEMVETSPAFSGSTDSDGRFSMSRAAAAKLKAFFKHLGVRTDFPFRGEF